MQIAAYDLLQKENVDIDEVIIVLTNEAKIKNWNDYVNDKGEKLIGLDNSWQKEFQNDNKIIRTVEIDGNLSKESQWSLFNVLFDLIENNDEIYFDITHGFRSFPLITLLILNYARLLKSAKIGRVIYGNIEILGPAYRIKKMSADDRVAFIEDVTLMLELFDWTNGVETFLRTGNPIILQNITQAALQKNRENNDIQAINSLVVQLTRLSQSIETCRGVKINDEINITKNKLNNVKNITTNDLIPFIKLIEKIEDKVIDFNDNSILNSIKIVEWCIKHNLYQQGYTILQESIISAVCDFIELEKNDSKNRLLVSTTINILIKNIDESEWNIGNLNREEVLKAVELIMPFREKLKVYDKITIYRNNINHYNMQKNGIKLNKVTSMLPTLLNESQGLLEELYVQVSAESTNIFS